MIILPDIGSHLGFDLQMTLKRKNNHFNVISVPNLVKNEVLRQILSTLFKKFKIQDSRRRPFWIYANKKICTTSQSDTLVFLEGQYIYYQKIKSYYLRKNAHRSVAGSQTNRPTHIRHILKFKTLNGRLKYKVNMFFTTPLLIHDKKYCLQVYNDKAILPPHYF